MTVDRRRLPLEWAGGITPMLDELWLVKEVLPQEGLAVLIGHPRAGKSSLAVDLGMHVAWGFDWNGRRTRRGTVVYLGAEGQKGLRNRIAAFRGHRGIPDFLPFALIPCCLDLFGSEDDQAAFETAIGEAAAESGFPISLIVIDTLSQTLGAGRENTDDLATYVRFCAALAKTFKCCVLIIHHRPKDSIGKDPRGHSSLSGAADTVLLAEGRTARKLSITKQRDGEEGPLCGFHLRPFPIGQDSTGAEVRSCVVQLQPVSQTQELSFRGRRGPHGKNDAVVLEALQEAIAASGEDAPLAVRRAAGDCPGRLVRMDVFLAKASEYVRTSSDTKSDTVRKRVQRAVKRLQESERIRIFGGFAWPTD